MKNTSEEVFHSSTTWNFDKHCIRYSGGLVALLFLCCSPSLLLPAVLFAQSLAIDSNALDLGVVGVGVEARASVSVENLQDDALEVIVGISGAGFGAVPDTLRLDGKGSGSVEVRFSATAAGEYAGELTLQVAALFKDERLAVPLQAVAVVPTLVLLPTEGLDFGAVPVGQMATAAVIVKNTGTVCPWWLGG